MSVYTHTHIYKLRVSRSIVPQDDSIFPSQTSPELSGEWMCSLGTLPATPKLFKNCSMDFDVPPHLLPWH